MSHEKIFSFGLLTGQIIVTFIVQFVHYSGRREKWTGGKEPRGRGDGSIGTSLNEVYPEMNIMTEQIRVALQGVVEFTTLNLFSVNIHVH